MRNLKGLDLALLDEPFHRSCTAQDDIRLKAHPNESEYDVTIGSQNANSMNKEYMMGNAFTNQGLAGNYLNAKSNKKSRPGTQQNNSRAAAVLDAYAGSQFFDLNGAVTINSVSNFRLQNNDVVPNYQDQRNRFQRNTNNTADISARAKAKLAEEKERFVPELKYHPRNVTVIAQNSEAKDLSIRLEGNHTDQRKLSISPMKDSFLKN